MNQVINASKIIIGVAVAFFNVLWVLQHIWLLYAYHFTKSLWLFMYPDWVLIMNISIGFIGVLMWYRLFKGKLTFKIALIIDIPLIIFGLFVSFYLTN